MFAVVVNSILVFPAGRIFAANTDIHIIHTHNIPDAPKNAEHFEASKICLAIKLMLLSKNDGDYQPECFVRG